MQYSCVIVRLLQKALFVFLQYYYQGALDQGETPLGLMLRPPSIYQGVSCQVRSSGLEVTW